MTTTYGSSSLTCGNIKSSTDDQDLTNFIHYTIHGATDFDPVENSNDVIEFAVKVTDANTDFSVSTFKYTVPVTAIYNIALTLKFTGIHANDQINTIAMVIDRGGAVSYNVFQESFVGSDTGAANAVVLNLTQYLILADTVHFTFWCPTGSTTTRIDKDSSLIISTIAQ